MTGAQETMLREWLDGEEFHTLCMDYRGASVRDAQGAFERLQAAITLHAPRALYSTRQKAKLWDELAAQGSAVEAYDAAMDKGGISKADRFCIHEWASQAALPPVAASGAEPKELSEEKIEQLCVEHNPFEGFANLVEFARAIHAASGAKAETQEPVAWQERQQTIDGWTLWYPADSTPPKHRQTEFEMVIGGTAYQFRPVYASPSPVAAEGVPTLASRIADLIEQHGSLRAAARVLECDAGYLSRLQSGEKDDPGAHLLRRMGLRQITTYERIKP